MKVRWPHPKSNDEMDKENHSADYTIMMPSASLGYGMADPPGCDAMVEETVDCAVRPAEWTRLCFEFWSLG